MRMPPAVPASGLAARATALAEPLGIHRNSKYCGAAIDKLPADQFKGLLAQLTSPPAPFRAAVGSLITLKLI